MSYVVIAYTLRCIKGIVWIFNRLYHRSAKLPSRGYKAVLIWLITLTVWASGRVIPGVGEPGLCANVPSRLLPILRCNLSTLSSINCSREIAIWNKCRKIVVVIWLQGLSKRPQIDLGPVAESRFSPRSPNIYKIFWIACDEKPIFVDRSRKYFISVNNSGLLPQFRPLSGHWGKAPRINLRTRSSSHGRYRGHSGNLWRPLCYTLTSSLSVRFENEPVLRLCKLSYNNKKQKKIRRSALYIS